MTDEGIEEIYGAVEASLASEHGQHAVPVHIFPYRFTDEVPDRIGSAPDPEFWINLKQGFDRFETENRPFDVFTKDGKYLFDPVEGAEPVSRVGLKSRTARG